MKKGQFHFCCLQGVRISLPNARNDKFLSKPHYWVACWKSLVPPDKCRAWMLIFFSTWSIGILLSALGKERPFLAYLRIGNCLSFLKRWQCFFKSFLRDCYFFFLFMVMLMHYLYLFCSLLPNFTIVLFLVNKYVLNTHEVVNFVDIDWFSSFNYNPCESQ